MCRVVGFIVACAALAVVLAVPVPPMFAGVDNDDFLWGCVREVNSTSNGLSCADKKGLLDRCLEEKTRKTMCRIRADSSCSSDRTPELIPGLECLESDVMYNNTLFRCSSLKVYVQVTRVYLNRNRTDLQMVDQGCLCVSTEDTTKKYTSEESPHEVY